MTAGMVSLTGCCGGVRAAGVSMPVHAPGQHDTPDAGPGRQRKGQRQQKR